MPILVLHGGAIFSGKKHPQWEPFMREVLTHFGKLLEEGLPALDAVVEAVVAMEDSGLFNAGTGGVLNTNGERELDAAVMEGSGLTAGAVANIKEVKNPVQLARRVMEETPHVLLAGPEADAWAATLGMEPLPPLDKKAQATLLNLHDTSQGTVGAVCLDADGNLAAATSTGGTSGKQPGRVGDTPIIGAGTYANSSVAVSCTGKGEYFIRFTAAHDVSALVEYQGVALEDAASVVIHGIGAAGGKGGLIAVDREGNIAMPFNSNGMIRGWVKDGEIFTAIR